MNLEEMLRAKEQEECSSAAITFVSLANLLVLIPASLAASSASSAVLWGWFVVPLGAPAITFWHAMGLLLLAAFTRQITRKSPSGKTGAERFENVCRDCGVFLGRIVYSGLALAIGWFAHSMMET